MGYGHMGMATLFVIEQVKQVRSKSRLNDE